eukprot:gene10200-7148_t
MGFKNREEKMERGVPGQEALKTNIKNGGTKLTLHSTRHSEKATIQGEEKLIILMNCTSIDSTLFFCNIYIYIVKEMSIGKEKLKAVELIGFRTNRLNMILLVFTIYIYIYNENSMKFQTNDVNAQSASCFPLRISFSHINFLPVRPQNRPSKLKVWLSEFAVVVILSPYF